MTRVLIDVDLADLELLAGAAEAEANRFRVAAEAAAAEVARDRAERLDVRTRSVRIVEVLGSAGRLVACAAAVRAAVAAPSAPQPSPAALDPAGAAGPAQAHTAPPALAEAVEDPNEDGLDPGEVTARRLRAAGRAALGPDAVRVPAPDEVTPAEALEAAQEVGT